MTVQGGGTLTVGGVVIDENVTYVGPLRESSDVLDDETALRDRLSEDGYLYLPGFHTRADVLDARSSVVEQLRAGGYAGSWHVTTPDEETGADVLPGARANGEMRSDVADRCSPLQALLYGPRMMALFEQLLQSEVRHFDFTWLRAYPPGPGTHAHMDTVFMNRGSDRVLTAWTPLGDLPLRMGGVAVLEASHHSGRLREGYADRDVDTYCLDDGGPSDVPKPKWNGSLSKDPATLRSTLGSRWLTAPYRAGDVLVFSMHTVHVGLDNRTDFLRLSCDSRYQPVGDPVDSRWVGPNPSAHGERSKIGVIC
jgi:hypothetical protein